MSLPELIAAMKAGKTITNGTHYISFDSVRFWWTCGDDDCCLADIKEADLGEWIDKPGEWRVMP